MYLLSKSLNISNETIFLKHPTTGLYLTVFLFVYNVKQFCHRSTN